MAKLTKEQKEIAKLHATAFEETFHTATENAGRRTDIDRELLYALGVFALMIGGEYRKIANKGETDD